MGSEIWVVKTTLPKSWLEFEVVSFAQELIEQGAACIQHHAVTSTYSWEGSVQSEQEWALAVKVSNSNKDKIVALISKSHPYDVPQIICSQYSTSEEYGNWVNSQ